MLIDTVGRACSLAGGLVRGNQMRGIIKPGPAARRPTRRVAFVMNVPNSALLPKTKGIGLFYLLDWMCHEKRTLAYY